MPKTLDAVVQAMLGAAYFQIAVLQIQVEDLTDQLDAARKASEAKAVPPLHDVKASR